MRNDRKWLTILPHDPSKRIPGALAHLLPGLLNGIVFSQVDILYQLCASDPEYLEGNLNASARW